MNRRAWFASLVALTLAAAAVAEEKHGTAAKNVGLERLKKLAGTWVEADAKGQPTNAVVTVFKVTSNGSAVQETIHPGSNHEMVSVYYMDGPDLVLTHYCSLGNQPHMKLDPKGLPHELSFKFVGGSNMDAAKDMHIHEGKITVVDEDHITWAWSAYEDGKPVEGHQMDKNLVRKK
jgi:hypothetical protein